MDSGEAQSPCSLVQAWALHPSGVWSQDLGRKARASVRWQVYLSPQVREAAQELVLAQIFSENLKSGQEDPI